MCLQQPIDAQIYTRIYSTTKPAAVDVYWQYHYHNRSREEEVSFHCVLLWRAHDPITTTSIIAPKITINDTSHAPRAGQNKWRLVFELNMNTPPNILWREINELTWGLTPGDLDHVHELLFGLDPSLAQKAGQVAKVDTVQLMLAAVGFVFTVATREYKVSPAGEAGDMTVDDTAAYNVQYLPAHPYEVGERDEQDPLDIAVTRWDFDECAGWLGAHARWACGLKLARDDRFLQDVQNMNPNWKDANPGS